MLKLFASFASVMAFVASGCQSSSLVVSETPISESPAAVPAALPTAAVATLWVKGLACPYCEHNINRQLTELPGVQSVSVNLPTGEIRVALLAKNPATRAQLVNAIDDSGFTLDRIVMPH